MEKIKNYEIPIKEPMEKMINYNEMQGTTENFISELNNVFDAYRTNKDSEIPYKYTIMLYLSEELLKLIKNHK